MDKKMHSPLFFMFLLVLRGFPTSYGFSDAKNGFYGIENIYFHSHPHISPKIRDFSAILPKFGACQKHAKIDDFETFFEDISKNIARIQPKISENLVRSNTLP